MNVTFIYDFVRWIKKIARSFDVARTFSRVWADNETPNQLGLISSIRYSDYAIKPIEASHPAINVILLPHMPESLIIVLKPYCTRVRVIP